ncbi:tropomyosin 1 alpha chain, putative [Perkinsus marinus ATCC 50983]|uniref:Tropomyosin 1 alpha chain, putative n=1 Tax=Perkinsus marinus (strain ATCC 50983 / TXsc) TaxID=423536 RepID=C5L4H4_PERM5|nr:tropomyosin 1 alpha chain, putative [Perkinsus marinus ATCC 50983]EER08411.1 tropomyosin 1 alpha chain, putative [Perkinsus marinus ATCC 50983]|eukprot:XP_002776595.1 tropomyosin 1 alpha chain, putative [Perkinsus marinus ATCC 50983]
MHCEKISSEEVVATLVFPGNNTETEGADQCGICELVDERVALRTELAGAEKRLGLQEEHRRRLSSRLASASRQTKIERSKKQLLERKAAEILLAVEEAEGDPEGTLSRLAEILNGKVAQLLLRASDKIKEERVAVMALKGEKKRLLKKLEETEREVVGLNGEMREMRLTLTESLNSSREEVEMFRRRSEAAEKLCGVVSARADKLGKERKQHREYIELLESAVERLEGELRYRRRQEVGDEEEQLEAFRRRLTTGAGEEPSVGVRATAQADSVGGFSVVERWRFVMSLPVATL